jgi:hypothetical protein
MNSIMKHTRLILLCITFCMPHIIFAMEHYPKQELSQLPTDTITIKTLNTLDEAINKQCSSNNWFVDFCNVLLLTERDALAIINLTDQPDNNIPHSLIDALREKNIFFNEAINYFSQYARTNRDAVTYETIDIIDNPKLQQPVTQLNSLAQPIKNYIMQRTQDRCRLTYDISLTHRCMVRLFIIHPTTDRAVTHSTDNQLRIWDLTTGKIIMNFQEKNALVLIQFNQDGSLMATAVAYKLKHNDQMKSRIKIRDPLSQGRPLYTFTQDARVYHINFMQFPSQNIIATFAQEEYDRKDRILTLWQCNDEQKFIKHSCSGPLPWRGDEIIEFFSDREKYEGYLDEEDEKIVLITKKKCPALYLCKQAIENHDCVDSLNDIKQKQPYQRLTEYEKELIQKDIKECKSQAQKNIPMYLALQRK